ncbi:LIM and calponin homology domains-containing protein 1-like isoform X1 [Girardinichthys multiradiatus]|uniref:LIM and calponin homology domains-containing protein 1-like isoform X1 n=1 Tax=Girardinichthys multiradiatus TaxID=208333 RepID=UPI001FAB5D95|nr:LIM and calponin homology domains-containing protein 1-like isoform X1 [Girardinichthys multiradiatus]
MASPEPSHPEPACLEAQKWIEAVTGKSFGDKDFRSALENGILLCELLSAIKPGLVKKINRLPTPIAGLDNLSVFLRGCEELGLKGSQLFDPGDLQDTSIRANLKDSDCNRKLKNVLNTVFWLGKAASGCASYSGPNLNLKEFEGLLAQMKLESDECGDSSQKRSVRDSGYDCWDSERSESLSPPRHTRDNSLDSLDSFGSRSQHSPSPDVVNRGNSDGRGSDSEADAPSRKPDVRKDDMLARRTASSESRCPVPFNQFLPNRTNASCYIPAARRKQHTEEGEQRSHLQTTPEQSKRTVLHHKTPKTVTWAPENNAETVKQGADLEVLEQRRLEKLKKAGIKVLPAAVRYNRFDFLSKKDHHPLYNPSTPIVEEKEVRSPSPNIILRSENEFLSFHNSACNSSSDEEQEPEKQRVPDVHRDDLASRRVHRSPVNSRVHQFVPPPVCTNKDRERWEGIRQASQHTLQEKEISEKEAVCDIITRNDNSSLREEEDEGEEGKDKPIPNKQRDDLARRRGQSRPLPQRDGPMSFVSSFMSQADMQKWERLRMTEPSEDRPTPVCQACLQKTYGSSVNGSAKAGRGHSKVVTFRGVTEIEQSTDTVVSAGGDETELLRRLLSKAAVAMPTIGLSSQLSERERSSLVAGSAPSQATPPPVDLQPWTTESTPTPAEIDARFAQYEQRAGAEEDDEEEKEERIPDLQKDDMMARKTGVFQKQTAAYNRFLPLPGSKWCSREEAPADAAPFSKKGMQAGKSKEFSTRVDSQRPKVPDETPQHQLEAAVIRAMSQTAGGSDEDEDNYDKNDHVPDVEKDDMMARRTRLLQKASVVRGNQCFNQFLPVPGSVKCNISPVSAVKQTCNRSKHTENIDRESIVAMTTQHEAPPLKAPASLRYPGLRGRRGKEKQEEGDTVMVPNAAVSDVTEPSSSSSSLKPPLSPPLAQIGRVEEELEVRREKEKIEEKNRDGIMKLEKKPSWLEDELPPMMVSRRVAFLLDNESVSMGDMANEEQVGHLPSLSPSRYERMQQQYNAFLEEGDHWQDDLARWKNRRRSASQELIKKEEERKRMEKRMKEDRVDGNRRKSIKTYKEIVEEKERREAELCEAYRNAATPEEAAMVLQRYALRFTISDATLDSLKLPRSTNKPKQDLNQTEQDPKLTSAVNNAEMLDHPNQPNSDVVMKQERLLARDIKTEGIHEIENSGVITTSSLTPDTNSQNEKPQSEHLYEPSTHLIDPHAEHQKQPDTGVPPPQTELASSQPAQPTHTVHSPLSAPSRPLPLLVAKPYCPPKSCPSGQKHVHVQKTDGLMRVNGEATEDFPPLQDPLQENKDVSSQQTQKHDLPEETEESPKTAEQLEHLQTEKSTLTSGSAISSLIAGRNCIITTTIVTELTKTYMELLQPDIQNNGQDGTTDYAETPAEENTEPAPSPSSMQEYSPTVSEGLEESSVTIETPMLNLAKRVNHWVWDPNEERKRLERWQQEQERLLQEQYQKEQEKLKKEWEKAQLEVEEEERKHNEEERRILEETAAPLSPSALLQKQAEHTTSSFSAEENNNTTVEGNVSLQQNGQKIHAGTQDQHASKLHFFQDSGFDDQPPKKQEMWKTASLDRSPQLNQAETVKRSGSHDAVKSNQDLSPPSASRCVSGKRLCSGCSNPLGRGAAMIIDTLGLFFHMQCFKCGVCKGQLGDATAGTDVRIRNGLLSCHECYIASRGRGQPTPL